VAVCAAFSEREKVIFDPIFAHLRRFVLLFGRFFASKSVFVSTPNFQKSTPFENLALTFSGLAAGF